MSALQSIREDCSTKTVGRVVGSIDGFAISGEARNENDRSDDLFSVHAHALLDASETVGCT